MAFGIIRKRLKQRAVYYAPLGEPSATGLYRYGEPEEIAVRWEDVAEEYIDQRGQPRVSKAKVGVLNDLEIGGILIKGKLSDLADPDNPMNNQGWGTIQKKIEIPDLKAKNFYREVYL